MGKENKSWLGELSLQKVYEFYVGLVGMMRRNYVDICKEMSQKKALLAVGGIRRF